MAERTADNIKVLYLYNYKGWAIHNVGKLWLSDIPDIVVTFKESKDFKKTDFNNYDLIWFGYLNLFIDCYSSFYINTVNMDKCIVSIHDPLELFSQEKEWKNTNISLQKWWDKANWNHWIKLQILKKIPHVVTASNEMKSVLQKNGIEAYLIPTTSSLMFREKNMLKTRRCSLLSVFEVYPRKDVSLMEAIQKDCTDTLKLAFDTKVGKKILPPKQYIELLDNHEIYICTSYQEGGPIPAMDAMQRGAIVLSTPVGQIQDIIKNGENGYICTTKEEFIDKITLLANDLKLLHKMRKASLEIISSIRSVKDIKSAAVVTIDSIVSHNAASTDAEQQKVRGKLMWLYNLILYKLSYGKIIERVIALFQRTLGTITHKSEVS